ncbi:cytochrome P450 2K6-like [Dendrobates tinctorius]|uniref:cytochrome P450 2K6-like n=1 Tax=Dendrobates tinctorius TaxID=92724 RepID=UPI003CCA52C0
MTGAHSPQTSCTPLIKRLWRARNVRRVSLHGPSPPLLPDLASNMELVTVLLSVVVIIFLAKAFNNQKQGKYKNFPPGPKPLPILGNILSLDMTKPHKTFYQLSKEYGPVFSVHMGMKKLVLLCGYDTIKDAMINNADVFSDRPDTPLFTKSIKDHGIVFAKGENWKVMRRFTLSTLRDYGMGKRTIEDKIIEEAECLAEKFRSYEGKPFGNFTSLNAAVANIIVSILLSKRFDYEDPTLLRLMGLVNENIRLLGSPWVRLAKTHGPVYSIKIGVQEMVVLSGYDVVKEALVNQAEVFSDRPKVPIFVDFSKGYGIAFSNGHSWRAMRRFTLSTLRDFGMGKRTIEDKINEEINYLMTIFKSYKGEPFNNTMIINTAVCNIIVSILFGHRFDYDDQKLHRLLKLVMENVKIIGSPMALLYNAFPSLMRWIPGTHKSVQQNVDELHSFIKEIFTKQKNKLDVNDQSSLIESFLVKQKEEKPNPELYFHDENLASLVADLFAAGMETTSTTLRWGLLLMMKYPEIQTNVQKEIDKVIGSAEPQMTHRKQMPYTDAVIHEIQRFANLVPTNVPHQTTQDVTLKGFFLPKGAHVIPSLTSVLRDDKYFKKPDDFYPQHFLDSDGNFVKSEAFMPFSAGKRSCAGENLAKMELFLFFTKLLQNFTFKAPPGAKLDLTAEVGFTLRPQEHEICAIPRY